MVIESKPLTRSHEKYSTAGGQSLAVHCRPITGRAWSANHWPCDTAATLYDSHGYDSHGYDSPAVVPDHNLRCYTLAHNATVSHGSHIEVGAVQKTGCAEICQEQSTHGPPLVYT